MSFSPIAFFAFNRPQHTKRTLAALAANREAIETDLHVFVDGPRNDVDQPLVAEVVSVANAAQGFRSVRVEISDTNRGLYHAITTGVSTIIDTSNRVIVVEDDILVSPHFLSYMNEALDRYRFMPQVGSIHAYSPPIRELPNFFFLRGGDCWGWATWADRWQLFQPDAAALLERLVSGKLLDEFCSSHGIGSLLLLIRRARRRNQSWAILWHASLFLANRLTLHPGTAFAANIGNDGSGAHSKCSDIYSTNLGETYHGLPADFPVVEDERAAVALRSFLDSNAFGNDGSIRRNLMFVYAKLAARFPALLLP